ncbi:MAG: class I SAM-dependent methyltransferase [Alphaproteobacteria bacterium]
MPDLRFNDVADIYSSARPAYPEEVYLQLLEAAAAPSFAVAVDIGCGAGQSLSGLIPIAETVIGVEPADKLRAAARKAFPGIEIVEGTGEATGLATASSGLITIATAFYWMDREKVLEEASRVLKPGGVFSAYKYDLLKAIGPVGDIVAAHLSAHWDAHRDPRLTGHDDTADVMRNGGLFASVTSQTIANRIDYPSAEAFVQFWRSTSYVSAYLRTLADPQAYLDGLVEDMCAVHAGAIEVNADIVMHIGKLKG